MLTNGAPLHHVWWFTRGEYYVTKLSLTESGWSIHAHNTRGSFICVKRKKEKTPEADFLQMLKCLEKLSNWMLRSPAPAVTGGVPCILFFCLWSKMLLCVPKKKEKKRKKKLSNWDPQHSTTLASELQPWDILHQGVNQIRLGMDNTSAIKTAD
jgi:hypothetical protein